MSEPNPFYESNEQIRPPVMKKNKTFVAGKVRTARTFLKSEPISEPSQKKSNLGIISNRIDEIDEAISYHTRLAKTNQELQELTSESKESLPYTYAEKTPKVIRKDNDFKCVFCKEKIDISNSLYYNVYNSDGEKTSLTCGNCKNKVASCISCHNYYINDSSFYKKRCPRCVANATKVILKSYTDKSERHFDKHISPAKEGYKFFSENAVSAYGQNNIGSFTVTSDGVFPKLLGIELEYETKGNYGKALIDIDELLKETKIKAILKRDGTLKAGVEVVSAPADKQYHYEVWGPFFDELNKNENIFCAPYEPPQDGAERGTGCGCHIHISKDALIHQSTYRIDLNPSGYGLGALKLTTFIHSPRNTKFIELMAGRPSNMFNNFTSRKGIQFKGDKIVSGGKEILNIKTDHRTAINFESSNGRTIEFRIFRSTKNKLELFKNIDFVDALCSYVTSAGIKEVEYWIYFYEFVCKNRQDYPYLYKWFQSDQGFIKLKQEARIP
jgi:hypothetical protein